MPSEARTMRMEESKNALALKVNACQFDPVPRKPLINHAKES